MDSKYSSKVAPQTTGKLELFTLFQLLSQPSGFVVASQKIEKSLHSKKAELPIDTTDAGIKMDVESE